MSWSHGAGSRVAAALLAAGADPNARDDRHDRPLHWAACYGSADVVATLLAAGAYEDFLRRWPAHRARPMALYQAGLCYLRLDRAGDAVDRWEALVRQCAERFGTLFQHVAHDPADHARWNATLCCQRWHDNTWIGSIRVGQSMNCRATPPGNARRGMA